MSDRKCECWNPLIEIWPNCIVAIIQGYVHEAYDDPLYTIKMISPQVDQYWTEFCVNDYLITLSDPPNHDEYILSYPERVRLRYPNITIILNLCPFISGNNQEVEVTYRMSSSMILHFEYACDFKNPWDFYELFNSYRISDIWREAASFGISMPDGFVRACACMQEFLGRAISYGNHFRIPEQQYIDARGTAG